MEQQPSQFGVGFLGPPRNLDSSITPIMSGNVPTSYDLLNSIVTNDTMVNQPDETNNQDNRVDRFLANPNNTQMVDEIIESRKNLIFANMASQGMTVASLDKPVIASAQEPPQQQIPPSQPSSSFSIQQQTQIPIAPPQQSAQLASIGLPPMDTIGWHYQPFYANSSSFAPPPLSGRSIYNVPINASSTAYHIASIDGSNTHDFQCGTCYAFL
ncbi:hypothetical protein SUGI_0788690 [Cryptomeria japonica]|nr:hypothetical protein SUGI_0788690 [Cryptomeria japonica]